MIGTNGLFDEFMPHGMCYQWRADILWLHVISDSIIALSYLVIPAALLYFMRKRMEVSYPGIVYMFCVFITACGITHIFSIWIVWSGHYGIQGIMKSFTAAASIATAVMLLPLIPKLLALRTPKELERANSLLRLQIKQREESEEKALQMQGELARVGRIRTMGHMATGLAHELNQPLLAISACTDTALMAAKSNPVNRDLLFDCLEDIQRDTHRAGEIIHTLRQFISKKAPTKSTIDINQLIYETVHLVKAEAAKVGAEILVNAGDVPKVNANGVQIAQVLVNLLRNAVEAIGGSKKTGRMKLIIVTSTHENESVIVSVKDSGHGVSASRDLFTPYESDKVGGMGLGLSISREIVETHRGVLRYNSDGLSGTTFTFDLPVSS